MIRILKEDIEPKTTIKVQFKFDDYDYEVYNINLDKTLAYFNDSDNIDDFEISYQHQFHDDISIKNINIATLDEYKTNFVATILVNDELSSEQIDNIGTYFIRYVNTYANPMAEIRNTRYDEIDFSTDIQITSTSN